MKIYRYEVIAYEEVDIKATDKEDAERIALAYWEKEFAGKFGGVEFVKEEEDGWANE